MGLARLMPLRRVPDRGTPLTQRSVVRAKAPCALAEDRYGCFFAALRSLASPLQHISLPTAGEAPIEPLRIVDEQGSLAVPMCRALAT